MWGSTELTPVTEWMLAPKEAGKKQDRKQHMTLIEATH
jgi:hypothetical protein